MQASQSLPVTTDLLSLCNIGISFSIPWERHPGESFHCQSCFCSYLPFLEWGGDCLHASALLCVC